MSKLTHESLRQMISEEISKLEASKSEPKSVKVTAKQLRGIILQEVRSMNEQASGNAEVVRDILMQLINVGPENGEELARIVARIKQMKWLDTNPQRMMLISAKNAADGKITPVEHAIDLISTLVGGKDDPALQVKALLDDDEKQDLKDFTKHLITLDV